MEIKWFYTYVLYSLKDFKLYIDFSTDLKNRLKKHNSGENKSTACRRPLIFILAEAFINEKDAREREKFYKTGRGREVLKKKLANTMKELENQKRK